VLIAGLALMAGADDANDYFPLLLAGATLVLYASVVYMSVFLIPQCCKGGNRASRRQAECCRRLLYRPIEPLTEAVDGGSATALATYVDQLDAAQPQLFFRVEGHINAHERALALRKRGDRQQRGDTHIALYGFTHHLPTTVAACSNATATMQEVADWSAKAGVYGTATVRYALSISPEDEEWAKTACHALEEAYRGHEGCQEVHVSLVYALAGVTSEGVRSYSSYNPADSIYDPLLRPGANHMLYRWSTTGTASAPGTAPSTGVLLPPEADDGQTYRAKLISRRCRCVALATCTYIPLICFLRGCVLKQAEFTHTKRVSLGRAIAVGAQGDTIEIVGGAAVSGPRVPVQTATDKHTA
jgi:hypothetical protein